MPSRFCWTQRALKGKLNIEDVACKLTMVF